MLYAYYRIPMQTLKCVNIVASLCLNTDLNLAQIKEKIQKNCKYNPSRFSGLSLRFENLSTTALLFRTGTVVLLGAKTFAVLDEAITFLLNKLKSLKIVIKKVSNIKIQNIVFSANCGHKIFLEKLADSNKSVIFEPELFCGAHFYIKKKPSALTATIFRSGNFYFSGAKSIAGAKKTCFFLKALLEKYGHKN